MGGIIAVTGTPGVGKTTLSKELARKLFAEYIDLNRYILDHKHYSTYDHIRKCPIITQNNLKKAVIELLPKYKQDSSKWVVLDSHMSHFLPTKSINFLIIVGCSKLNTLKTRLEKRGYSEQKVRENLDSEIFEICKIEAIERHSNAIYIDTSDGTVKSQVLHIINTIKKSENKIHSKL